MVELMVALVITLILLAGIGQIFLSSKKSFTIQNNLARIQENGRYAMEVVISDLRPAGYWGASTPPLRSHAPLQTRLTGHVC
jgi:type IV pilus assembly protein PilW